MTALNRKVREALEEKTPAAQPGVRTFQKRMCKGPEMCSSVGLFPVPQRLGMFSWHVGAPHSIVFRERPSPQESQGCPGALYLLSLLDHCLSFCRPVQCIFPFQLHCQQHHLLLEVGTVKCCGLDAGRSSTQPRTRTLCDQRGWSRK